MKINSDIYNVCVTHAVASMATVNHTFNLNKAGQFRISNIVFDLEIFETASNIKLPLDLSTTQRWEFLIRKASPPIGSNFQDFSIPLAVVDYATGIRLYKPGQYSFSRWFIENTIGIVLQMANRDVALSYSYNWTIVIETEQL